MLYFLSCVSLPTNRRTESGAAGRRIRCATGSPRRASTSDPGSRQPTFSVDSRLRPNGYSRPARRRSPGSTVEGSLEPWAGARRGCGAAGSVRGPKAHSDRTLAREFLSRPIWSEVVGSAGCRKTTFCPGCSKRSRCKAPHPSSMSTRRGVPTAGGSEAYSARTSQRRTHLRWVPGARAPTAGGSP